MALRRRCSITSGLEKNMHYLTPDELLVVWRTARSCSSRDWAMILVTWRVPHG